MGEIRYTATDVGLSTLAGLFAGFLLAPSLISALQPSGETLSDWLQLVLLFMAVLAAFVPYLSAVRERKRRQYAAAHAAAAFLVAPLEDAASVAAGLHRNCENFKEKRDDMAMSRHTAIEVARKAKVLASYSERSPFWRAARKSAEHASALDSRTLIAVSNAHHALEEAMLEISEARDRNRVTGDAPTSALVYQVGAVSYTHLTLPTIYSV